MLVFWKHKLVLFALPKTGTTALEAALSARADIAILHPPGLKHCNVTKYECDFAPVFETRGTRFERFALIREPMDWLASWYRFRSRPNLKGSHEAVPDIPFDAFVREWLKPKPAAFAQVGLQSKFLVDEVGRLGVDMLFRYENMTSAVRWLETRLDQKIDLGRLNVSGTANVAIDPGLRAEVEAATPRDFALWDLAE